MRKRYKGSCDGVFLPSFWRTVNPPRAAYLWRLKISYAYALAFIEGRLMDGPHVQYTACRNIIIRRLDDLRAEYVTAGGI